MRVFFLGFDVAEKDRQKRDAVGILRCRDPGQFAEGWHVIPE
jgi:hypothetical protein